MSKCKLHNRQWTTGLRDYETALRRAQGPCLVLKSRSLEVKILQLNFEHLLKGKQG